MKSVKQQEFLARLLATLVKSAALFAVALSVSAVVNYKLTLLKQDKQHWEVTHVAAEERLRQLNCLTQNIYWEAASEPFEGKVAVAQVTLNRVESGRFAPTVCGVVYQKNVFYERVVCQFSWLCESTHKNKAVYQPQWAESELVAKKVMMENFRLPSMKKAMYYHNDTVQPNWRKPRIDKIGHHTFYGEAS